MKEKRIIVVILGIGVLAVVFHYFWKKSHTTDVPTYELYNVKLSEELMFEGKVTAVQEQDIMLKEDYGTIKKIHVQNGEQVTAGQVLITCTGNEKTKLVQEKKDLREQYESFITKLNEQKNAIMQLKSEAENEALQIQKETENLNAENAETEQLFNDLKIRLEQAQKKKQEKENKIIKIERDILFYGKCIENIDASINTLNNSNTIVLTADFDGIVKVNEAGKTDNSVPVIKVYSNEHEVVSSVTEYDIEKIEEGQKVNLSYVNQNKQIEGTIQSISNIPKENSASIANYEISIIPNETIHLGYTTQVLLSQDTMYIPNETIIKEGNSNYVYKFIDGKAIKKRVVCEESGQTVRIIDGLENGDDIIIEPKGLKDQMEVKIR